jgi:hypothetical protein
MCAELMGLQCFIYAEILYRQKVSFFELSRFLKDGTLPGDVIESLTFM